MKRSYDEMASVFAAARSPSIGVVEVREWASKLAPAASVADLGCGSGYPLTAALVDLGCRVYAVDSSPKLLQMLAERLPQVEVECADVAQATFGGAEHTFDGCLAWGLLFLLSQDTQREVIALASRILRPGGELLFTSPMQEVTWLDAQTGIESRSLGAPTYRKLLLERGFSTPKEFDDAGGNYYYSSSYLG
jgi:SAM-dependent methyltransferase